MSKFPACHREKSLGHMFVQYEKDLI